MNRQFTIGILGGMGPRATVEFERRLIKRFEGSDQTIPQIVTINDGSIPDRTRFLLGDGADPLDQLAVNAERLLKFGATIICMPCNTAHADRILGRLQAQLALPIIDMPTACLAQAAERDCQSVLILGTDGTRFSNVFDSRAIDLYCVYPSANDQRIVNRLIRAIKCGEFISPAQVGQFQQIIDEASTDAAILACTELSLLKGRLPDSYHIIDSLDALAQDCYEQAVLAYNNMVEE